MWNIVRKIDSGNLAIIPLSWVVVGSETDEGLFKTFWPSHLKPKTIDVMVENCEVALSTWSTILVKTFASSGTII